MTYRLLEKKSRVWEINMWVVTVDFAKAVDTIQQNVIWRSLRKHCASKPVCQFLEEVFLRPFTDVESDLFPIVRGTKQ